MEADSISVIRKPALMILQFHNDLHLVRVKIAPGEEHQQAIGTVSKMFD